MAFRDSMKALRKELGKTQVEIAKALHISVGTVSRWELGSHYPNHSVSIALLKYAESQGASKECISRLKQCNLESIKHRQQRRQGDLFSIEHSSLEGLVECVRFPIYVCDIETDELLYMNRVARQMVSADTNGAVGRKCYECIMHRDTPCEFCHKADLKDDDFLTYDAFRPYDGTAYRIQGKLIRWDGRDAQIRCVSNVGQTVFVSVQAEREQNYKRFLAAKASASPEYLVTAHFNLSRNTVCSFKTNVDAIAVTMKAGNVDELLGDFKRSILDQEEQKRFSFCFDRTAMINMFYIGQTHISIRHHLKIDNRLYETTFDLLQNPTTLDIEAIGVLGHISINSLAEEVTSALLGLDYEMIALVDAATGEVHPITQGQSGKPMMEQNTTDDSATLESPFLNMHYICNDAERMIQDTNIQNVVHHLETGRKYVVTRLMKIGESVVPKRMLYTYLDSTHSIILCAVQDFSELNSDEAAGRMTLAATAMDIIQTECNIHIGYYDLQKGILFYGCDYANGLGYENAIVDMPESMIREGNVSPISVDEFRGFYNQLKEGIVTNAHVAIKAKEGSFHWYKLSGKILADDAGHPKQALIIQQDVNDLQGQTTAYQKWKQSLGSRSPETYSLLHCNVSKDAPFDIADGSLLTIDFNSIRHSFSKCTGEYAAQFVHPDDRQAYVRFLKPESLLMQYHSGTTAYATNYREYLPGGEFRWIHLSATMVQYSDSDDVGVFLLYEQAQERRS